MGINMNSNENGKGNGGRVSHIGTIMLPLLSDGPFHVHKNFDEYCVNYSIIIALGIAIPGFPNPGIPEIFQSRD